MALLLVLCGLFGPLADLRAYVGPLDIVTPGLPSPTDVIWVIDVLTKKDSETSMEVKVGNTTGQGKLFIARTRVDVAMERSSRNWRGRVVVQMNVPSDINYSVDLSKIRPEHIRLDAKNRRLLITMPMPEVESVTPQLTDLQIDNTFRRARFKVLDGDISRQLQNSMLREDYQARARKAGADRIPQVREQGKDALQAFLQRLLGRSFPGITVVVD
jgi:hypothetical protein